MLKKKSSRFRSYRYLSLAPCPVPNTTGYETALIIVRQSQSHWGLIYGLSVRAGIAAQESSDGLLTHQSWPINVSQSLGVQCYAESPWARGAWHAERSRWRRGIQRPLLHQWLFKPSYHFERMWKSLWEPTLFIASFLWESVPSDNQWEMDGWRTADNCLFTCRDCTEA